MGDFDYDEYVQASSQLIHNGRYNDCVEHAAAHDPDTNPASSLMQAWCDFQRSLLIGDKDQIEQVRDVCSNLADKTAGSGLVKSAAVGAISMVGRMFGKKTEEAPTSARAAVNAIATLMKAALLLQQGNRVKGFFGLRSSYLAFVALPDTHEDTPEARYVRATRLYGIGVFQLFLSYLPPNMLTLLNMVGFSADKEAGSAMLEECRGMDGFYGPWATVMLAVKNLIEARYAFNVEEEVVLIGGAWDMIQALIERFPNGSLFQWVSSQVARFAGRIPDSCAMMDRAISNAVEVSAIGRLDRMEKERAWCLFAKMDWKGVVDVLTPLMQHEDCMLRAWCATMLGCACGMIGQTRKSTQYFECVPMVANDTEVDQAFVTKCPQLARRVRPETAVCEILYQIGRVSQHNPPEWIETVEQMCTPEEGDELAPGEVIATTLIRCCLMQYTGRLEECEAQLRSVILEPYEAGTLGHEPDEVWVIAHAYMMLGTVFARRKDYEPAKELLTSASSFDKFAFSGSFHFQLKNTQDYVERNRLAAE